MYVVRTYYGRHKNIYILLTMFTGGKMWFMTHDALGSSPRGMIVVLYMILKTQSISKNTTQVPTPDIIYGAHWATR
jgi:hypothetical protein